MGDEVAVEEMAAVLNKDAAEPGMALLKKKKKKKRERRFQDDIEDMPGPAGDGPADDTEQKEGGKYPWSGTDKDYTYEELLDRAYSILREKNPELTGVIKKISLKPPTVSREGTKKTVLMNFADLCKSFNRHVDQVMPFLTADMGTTGSLDGQNRLIMKGRFQPHNFATVLRRYINEYVLCASCKSFDTLLDRDSATRLMYLRCQQCGASRSVQAIKSGYMAQVGRRPKK